MLMTDPRRAFGRREEDDEHDPWQGSLFAPDALAPPAKPKPPGPTPDPFAAPRAPARAAEAEAAPPVGRAEAAPPVGRVEAAPPGGGAVLPAYEDEPVEYFDDPDELEPAHAHASASRSVLAGPTLDDVMSRIWEGLRAEVPTPCPVCHAEIEPSAHGHCGACGSTLA